MTGNERHVEKLQSTGESIDQDLRAVRSQMADHPGFQSRLDRLAGVVNQKKRGLRLAAETGAEDLRR